MTKVKSLIILLIAVVGCFLINKHFEKREEEEIHIDKFSSEYTMVSPNNIFKYSTIDEIISTLESGSGFVFLCTPTSDWCNYYAAYLNEELMNNNIDVIYYYNIDKERQLNTVRYQKILTLLDSYLYKNDTQNGIVYMPDLTVVKDGVIIAHDNETSFVMSDQNTIDYWTNEKIHEFKNKINSFVTLLNMEGE